jgi:hypothetical protein
MDKLRVWGMRYLICDNCHAKYRLKPDESTADFSGCSCGGNLQYQKDSNLSRKHSSRFKFSPLELDSIFNRKVFAGFLVIFFLISAGVAVSIYDSHSHAQTANNTTENSGNIFADVQTSPQNASQVVLGATDIQVPKGATVVTQVDRIIKDPESKIKVNVANDRQPKSPNDLVPFMEGARVKELMKYANVKVVPATNVPVKMINNTWYGPDDKGNYVYAIDPGKMTNLRSQNLSDGSRIATVTHGFNVMVPDAIKNNASLVIACGDLPGKAQAEAYLNTKGINCYAPCDRFTFSLLDQNSSGTSLGTMPIRALKNGNGAVIGAQPVALNLKEKIIVQTTNKGYPEQYCDTPKRYFEGLEKTYGIKLDKVIVDGCQSQLVVQSARKNGANIIAVRVANDKDKGPVKDWLRENSNHRAILFHSAAYEPGYSLFFEFPNQVTGDDTKPVFINNISSSELQNKFTQVRSLWQ